MMRIIVENSRGLGRIIRKKRDVRYYVDTIRGDLTRLESISLDKGALRGIYERS